MARLPTDSKADVATLAAVRAAVPDGGTLRLSVLDGPDAGRAAVVAGARALIGRGATTQLQLTDRTVSTFHAEISSAGGGVLIADLNSRNGTYYAGARLERAVVPAGAELQLGETRVRVDRDGDATGEVRESPSFGELRARDPAMRALFATLARLGRTELSVLIEGPTGTGKELTARGLHRASVRAGGPFVVLDCTAIPSTLAESVLFGHEKGAFTGASERRAGVFEAAEGGTVFLDEVGELPLELQPKLLRVLERREVVRVGSTRALAVNVRVLSATWRDLRVMINEGRFREDLYYRLAQARVVIPPLRERPADVPFLIRHFLELLPSGTPCARAISPEAVAELARRDYPGNVRELRNTVERAAMMAEGGVITEADLAFERILTGERARAAVIERASSPSIAPSVPGPEAPVVPFKDAKKSLVEEFEREYVRRLLARTGGNLTQAANLAGIERHYFRELFRKHGLDRGED